MGFRKVPYVSTSHAFMSRMQTSMQVAKRALRKELKMRLSALKDDIKQQQSTKVTEKLLKLNEYKQSHRISVYLSMPSELNTLGILQDIFKRKKECFMPHYIGGNMDMVKLASMNDYETLPLTSWNIKQPKDDDHREDAIQTGGLDLILVPGLGFTWDGFRIGRGKGYYDNYMKKHFELLQRSPVTIGLAFSEQICETIPCDEHDVKLDLVLFP